MIWFPTLGSVQRIPLLQEIAAVVREPRHGRVCGAQRGNDHGTRPSIVYQVMVIGTVSDWVFLPFGFSESVACRVTVYLPFVVGVPVIAPVVALKVHPGGRLPESFQWTGGFPPLV